MQMTMAHGSIYALLHMGTTASHSLSDSNNSTFSVVSADKNDISHAATKASVYSAFIIALHKPSSGLFGIPRSSSIIIRVLLSMSNVKYLANTL